MYTCPIDCEHVSFPLSVPTTCAFVMMYSTGLPAFPTKKPVPILHSIESFGAYTTLTTQFRASSDLSHPFANAPASGKAVRRKTSSSAAICFAVRFMFPPFSPLFAALQAVRRMEQRISRRRLRFLARSVSRVLQTRSASRGLVIFEVDIVRNHISRFHVRVPWDVAAISSRLRSLCSSVPIPAAVCAERPFIVSAACAAIPACRLDSFCPAFSRLLQQGKHKRTCRKNKTEYSGNAKVEKAEIPSDVNPRE